MAARQRSSNVDDVIFANNPTAPINCVCILYGAVGVATRFQVMNLYTLTHILANVIFNYSDREWVTHLPRFYIYYVHKLVVCTQVLGAADK